MWVYYWTATCTRFQQTCMSRTRKNQWKHIEDLRCRRSSISKYKTSISVNEFHLWYRSNLRCRITSISQKLRYRSTGLLYPYMNFSFDIEVIVDIGLLRCRNLLRYRSIFNIEVLWYRSLKTSISKFCEIRDFDIEVKNFDIEVQYRALYRSQNKLLRYRSFGTSI